MSEAQSVRRSRSTLAEYVHADMRRMIFSGEIWAGEQLKELELAERYQVSQGTIREVLARLAEDGLVVKTYRRETRVISISDAEYDDLINIRATIEAQAIRRCCENVDPELMSRLARLIDLMRESAAQGDVEACHEYDVMFHRALTEAADSKPIRRTWESVHGMTRLAMVQKDVRYIEATEVASAHQPIFDALVARDAEKAAAANREHFLRLPEGQRNRSER